MEAVYGIPISPALDQSVYRYLETDQFAFERILTYEMSQRFSTSSAGGSANDTEADFIYIPLDTRAVARCFGSCPALVGHTQEGFDRHALRRTLVDWITATVSSLSARRSYPSFILALALIRHDYEGNILNQKAMGVIKDDVVVLGIEQATWETTERLHHFRQVPYPSWFHVESHSTSIGEWQLSRKRETLSVVPISLIAWLTLLDRLVFAGKSTPSQPKGGKGPHNGYALRQALVDELSAERADDVVLKIMERGTKREEIVALHRALAKSIFAITPPGDSPTRKGFFDALLLGSIPVIFREGTYSNVFPELRLEDLAIFIPESEMIEGVGETLVERLRAVTREEIRKKQVGIAEVATMMQYSLPRDDGVLEASLLDATAVILRGLRSLRDSSL